MSASVPLRRAAGLSNVDWRFRLPSYAPSRTLMKLDCWRKKSSPGRHPRSFCPARNGEARALARVSIQPMMPPHSASRALSLGRRSALSFSATGHPAFRASTL